MGEAIPFPETQPRGYEWLDGEAAFDPERHLQLETPSEVLMLADLGYEAAEIAPHPMPVHLGHLNYEPSQIDVGIDKWHHDTLLLDYVLAVTDPAKVAGGRFEWFEGTKHEAAALADAGEPVPAERTVAPEFPGPGYAVALHGDMVVHRAGPLDEMCERISMVNGYVSMDTAADEQSRTKNLVSIDDDETLWTEWAKFAAWRSKDRLAHLIDELEFTSDRDAVIFQLDSAIDDAQHAIAEMRADEKGLLHYGG